MANKGILTKILTVTGSVLVWFPILAPVLAMVPALFTRHRFLFDYLMPFELFPSVVVGGILLLWAARRARSRLKLIAWGFGAAVVMLVGEMALATFSGLASGAIEPTGWWGFIVSAVLLIYTLAVIAVGVGGVLLLCDLFKRTAPVSTAG